ncbi:MAG: 5-formaminoimidazole-4-carboxamide-1-(beta)-D-ribofuranosyl 5'-monophosphate synthetase [Candidatus Thorarchaeota archaeon]|nr:MAG: 5-formaminoimidazole-4-carboxamide-1-(beta)-D-ribofuranosyl 5'-monophosphate synthetase [Candidatus Thorarchaeota archaeon]
MAYRRAKLSRVSGETTCRISSANFGEGHAVKLPIIGTLGSHSAEEIGVAAKSHGFDTVIVCEKGREKLYSKYDKHLFDHFILLDRFDEVLGEEVQTELTELNTLWIPNRAFTTYVPYDDIEKRFKIPIYGNRGLLRVEDRGGPRDQQWLLDQCGIRTPKRFTPNRIDRLAIVKVHQKARPHERAFFCVVSAADYESQSRTLIKQGVISEKELANATIEEFVIAARFNANFQAYAIEDDFGALDLVGFDDRIQTNLGGLLNLPARDQLKLTAPVTNEEAGHFGVTMRESKKPLVYETAEKFLVGVRKHFPPKMIGLFSLQGALTEQSEFVVFDVSVRVPGAPCVGPTSPEMRRLALKLKQPIESPLDLCMIDIKTAAEEGRLAEAST